MNNLEKQLSNLPKPKLSTRANFKIKLKIYRFVFYKNLKHLFRPITKTKHLFARLAIATFVMVVVLASTSLYAYANDSITIGDTLYPLKKAIESIEQKITVDENAKIDTLGKISEKRAREALNLAEEANTKTKESKQANQNIKKTIDEVIDNIDSAIKTADEIKDSSQAKQAKEGLKKKKDSIIEYLDDISNIAEENNNDEIIQEVEKAKENINKHDDALSEDEPKQQPEPAHNNEASTNNQNTENNSGKAQGASGGGQKNGR